MGWLGLGLVASWALPVQDSYRKDGLEDGMGNMV